MIDTVPLRERVGGKSTVNKVAHGARRVLPYTVMYLHGTSPLISPCAPSAPGPLGLGLYGDGAHGGMRRGERRTEVDAWRQLGGLDWDGC